MVLFTVDPLIPGMVFFTVDPLITRMVFSMKITVDPLIDQPVFFAIFTVDPLIDRPVFVPLNQNIRCYMEKFKKDSCYPQEIHGHTQIKS